MGADRTEEVRTGKRRIMIIEDDPDMIELLSLIVRRGGYEPVAALGGQEGVRKLQELGADLVLLDLMMGDMSGWLVLQTVKGDETLQHIPVLIVSAKHQMEDPSQAEAFAHLFEGYLVKPFVVQDLLSQITEALS
ncbi:MAG: response regulator [Anaerolineaceae bacterium]|nr:response regulator [Anaerolineaceae bacterium]